MFVKYSRILFLSLILLIIGNESSTAQTKTKLPSLFRGDRIYLQPVTKSGVKLSLYANTGGGINMLYLAAVKKLGLKTDNYIIPPKSFKVVNFPEFKKGHTIPPPANVPPFGRRMYVPATSKEYQGGDGFLGATWFAGKILEFNYPAKTVAVIDSFYSPSVSERKHLVPLGFQVDSLGHITTFFPRIKIEVDGEPLNFLYATGAAILLNKRVFNSLKDGLPRHRATSLVVKSVFEKWRKKHPDWKVIENADTYKNMPMIRVPEITIGGYKVGPVWFTMRPDKNFRITMSNYMDEQIDGALGGSAFQYFRIILNYPGRYAIFTK